jgi:hypothetical protein
MTAPPHREAELLFYAAPDGTVKVGVIFRDETAWLTQKALAELFGVGVPAITNLKNIFDSGELAEDSVVSILETTAADGKSYRTRYYNLDAIIAVGYRVNSYQATQFRIWATRTLREFVIKGFVLDDERLKQGKAHFGKDSAAQAEGEEAVSGRIAAPGRSTKDRATEALEKIVRTRRSPSTGWRAVFGHAKPGSTRDVDRRVKEIRRVDPREWE